MQVCPLPLGDNVNVMVGHEEYSERTSNCIQVCLQRHSQAGATEKEEKAEELSASVRVQCRDLSTFDYFGSRRISSGTSLSTARVPLQKRGAMRFQSSCAWQQLRLLTKARAQAKANDIKFVSTPGPQIQKEREEV